MTAIGVDMTAIGVDMTATGVDMTATGVGMPSTTTNEELQHVFATVTNARNLIDKLLARIHTKELDVAQGSVCPCSESEQAFIESQQHMIKILQEEVQKLEYVARQDQMYSAVGASKFFNEPKANEEIAQQVNEGLLNLPRELVLMVHNFTVASANGAGSKDLRNQAVEIDTQVTTFLELLRRAAAPFLSTKKHLRDLIIGAEPQKKKPKHNTSEEPCTSGDGDDVREDGSEGTVEDETQKDPGRQCVRAELFVKYFTEENPDLHRYIEMTKIPDTDGTETFHFKVEQDYKDKLNAHFFTKSNRAWATKMNDCFERLTPKVGWFVPGCAFKLKPTAAGTQAGAVE